MPLRSICIALVLILTSCKAQAQLSTQEIVQLKAMAAATALAKDPQWAALLHYHSSVIHTDGKSIVDDGRFFLSHNGKTNLKQELDAAIEAFFGPAPQQELHPQCRFPARYLWLKHKLAPAQNESLDVTCEEFASWQKSLNAKGMSLIFPASYLNNPASAFGHTLLRFDTGRSAKDGALLSYTASYAASINNENAVLYALKGIFGGYVGRFSVLPYHKKVRQYNDIEHRDIWEYRLDFSPHEIDFATRHLWELKDAVFDYYYFDDNCAFIVLSYLDAIRPELRSSKRLWPWVIPIDTIHALINNSDLVAETIFRPSAATTLNFQLKRTTSSVKQFAYAASTDISQIPTLINSPLSANEKAEALELAFERMRYYELSGREPNLAGKQRALALLKSRSSLGRSQTLPEVPQPQISPEQGHPTVRLALGAGRSEGRAYYELEVRPAYHDLLDPSGGFVRGSEIKFLELAARQHENGNFQLQRFVPLQIRSLSPRNLFLHPLSWEFSGALQRKNIDQSGRHLITSLGASVGPAWEPLDSVLFFALIGPRGEYSDSIPQNHALGLSLKSGILVEPTDNFAIFAEAEGTRFGIGDSQSQYNLNAGIRLTLRKNLALRFGAAKTQAYRYRSTELMLSLHVFQ